jgi:hypothetical protein
MNLLVIVVVLMSRVLSKTIEEIQDTVSNNQSENVANFTQMFSIIPSDFMNELSFVGLGLNNISCGFHNFVVPSMKYQAISIPYNANLLFVFKVNEEVSLKSKELPEIIVNSPPFQLPQSAGLVELFMVIPKLGINVNQDLNITFDLIDSKLSSLFRSESITHEKPAVVLMYENISKCNKKIQNEYSSTFFDDFAVNWLKSSTFDKLVHSVFCSIVNESKSLSYCIQISPTQIVSLFPAYDHNDDFAEIVEPGLSSQNHEFRTPVSSLPISDKVPTSLNTLPRANYSQILYAPNHYFQYKMLKRDSIFSNSSDCRKITWYNIFRYSVFGNFKFCIDET